MAKQPLHYPEARAVAETVQADIDAMRGKKPNGADKRELWSVFWLSTLVDTLVAVLAGIIAAARMVENKSDTLGWVLFAGAVFLGLRLSFTAFWSPPRNDWEGLAKGVRFFLGVVAFGFPAACVMTVFRGF